jgi:hypothetical protein
MEVVFKELKGVAGLGQHQVTKQVGRVERSVAIAIMAYLLLRKLHAKDIPADRPWSALSLQRAFAWEMVQVACNVTMEEWGFLASGQYLIHERDGKYCPAFHQIIEAAEVKRVPLPPRAPNLNAYAERWVRSVKEECLARMILFGEASLRHALKQHVEHCHSERNHRARATCCSSLRLAKAQRVKARFGVVNGSEGSRMLCARSRMSFLTT